MLPSAPGIHVYFLKARLDGLPSQYEERFCPLRQEPCEFVDQDVLDFICLLDLDADTYAVHTRLDEDFLILIA